MCNSHRMHVGKLNSLLTLTAFHKESTNQLVLIKNTCITHLYMPIEKQFFWKVLIQFQKQPKNFTLESTNIIYHVKCPTL